MSVADIPQAVSELGGKLMASLPGQFLALCVINVFFVLGLLWFLQSTDARRVDAEQHAMDARERMLTPILTACVQEVPASLLQREKER